MPNLQRLCPDLPSLIAFPEKKPPVRLASPRHSIPANVGTGWRMLHSVKPVTTSHCACSTDAVMRWTIEILCDPLARQSGNILQVYFSGLHSLDLNISIYEQEPRSVECTADRIALIDRASFSTSFIIIFNSSLVLESESISC